MYLAARELLLAFQNLVSEEWQGKKARLPRNRGRGVGGEREGWRGGIKGSIIKSEASSAQAEERGRMKLRI